MNRKGRRTQASNTRKAVRGIVKAAGQTEPTAEEKDPAFLALQVRSLHSTIENFVKAQDANLQSIQKAFSMVDVHQQILQRLAREVTTALTRVRRLQVDGNVDMALDDFGELKVREDGTLDMHSYYEDYRNVASLAGPRYADLAVVLWSQGSTVEDAVERAKVEKDRQVASGEPVVDPDYEEEFFGGDHGKDHHQQVQASAEANG